MTIRNARNAIYIALLLFIFACSKSGSSTEESVQQPQQVNALLLDPENPCPPGTHPVLTYEFSQFRFKRPITNCMTGFWFCTTDGEWVITCVPNSTPPVARIDGETAFVWAEVEDSIAILHFPLALKDDPEYSSTDLATFSADGEYEIFPGIVLDNGNYTVVETEHELLVTVNLKL